VAVSGADIARLRARCPYLGASCVNVRPGQFGDAPGLTVWLCVDPLISLAVTLSRAFVALQGTVVTKKAPLAKLKV